MSLGFAHHGYYQTTKISYHLETAIQVYNEALEIWPNEGLGEWAEGYDKAMAYIELGSCYSDRFLTTDAESDFKLGIDAFRNAQVLATEGSWSQAWGIQHIGMQYSLRNKAGDLDTAIQHLREALDTNPEHNYYTSSPIGARAGNLYYTRFRIKRQESDLEAAIECFEQALKAAPTTTREYIKIASSLIAAYREKGDLSEAWKIAANAVTYNRHYLPSFLTYGETQSLIRDLAGFASLASALALSTSRQPIEALEILERGRGIMAVTLMENRIDLPPIPKFDYRSSTFSAVRKRLEAGRSLRTSKSGSGTQETLRDRIQLIRAGQEYDDILPEFLWEMEYSLGLKEPVALNITSLGLDLVTKKGPVVVINSNYRSDAFLITKGGGIQMLPLQSISQELIEKKSVEAKMGGLEVLEWLWDAIMSPILDALGFTEPPSDGNWPHVWWIPVGALSRLPLHAAGRHDRRSGETVMDRVISSYSRSIYALIDIYKDPLPEKPVMKPQALVVAMEQTPGSSPLPFATREIETITKICGSTFQFVQPRRRKRDVMAHLDDCDVFHFAGHGYTDTRDPSASHLRLEDWKEDPLRVADLMQINLHKRHPFLAYLSACGTSEIREAKYLDEGAHLLGACQLAGFRHAIGTLWSVKDKMCVDVARIVYEEIRDSGLVDESVSLGVHKAGRELRDRWLDAGIEEARSRAQRHPKPGSEYASGQRSTESRFRIGRDVVPCDDDLGPAHWAPYVHYGV